MVPPKPNPAPNSQSQSRSHPLASCPKPTDPILRTNPFPKVAGLFCRLPLPTLFDQPEAAHLAPRSYEYEQGYEYEQK